MIAPIRTIGRRPEYGHKSFVPLNLQHLAQSLSISGRRHGTCETIGKKTRSHGGPGTMTGALGGPTGGRSDEPRHPDQFLFTAKQDSGFLNARLCVAVLVTGLPALFHFISGLAFRTRRTVSTDAEAV